MYNKYYVNVYENIDDLYDVLEEIGFDNDVDGSSNHYYWRADTPKKIYLSLESQAQGNYYVEFFLNIQNGETTEKFQIQPFTLRTNGDRPHQQTLIVSVIPLYGGGLVFGIRAGREYQTDYSGDFIYLDGAICPPAKWFAIIPPEDRHTDEWIYLVFDGAFIYDAENDEYKNSGDRLYGSTTGEITPCNYATIPSRDALNCTALTNIYTTNNNVNKVFKNLWTYGLENGDSYHHRIFTVKNKKYIILNDPINQSATHTISILCRYA